MVDVYAQAKATKPRSGRQQSKAALPEPMPGASGQHLSKEKGHRHASKGCSEKAKDSKATERDERRRDKALQKLCEKST